MPRAKRTRFLGNISASAIVLGLQFAREHKCFDQKELDFIKAAEVKMDTMKWTGFSLREWNFARAMSQKALLANAALIPDLEEITKPKSPYLRKRAKQQRILENGHDTRLEQSDLGSSRPKDRRTGAITNRVIARRERDASI
jgi:hypothetical protein